MATQYMLVRISKTPLAPPTPERILFPLNGTVMTIGRNESAKIQLKSANPNGTMLVSRQHARLWFDYTTLSPLVADIESTNGVWVNGKRLQKGVNHVLQLGDIVSFGTDTGNHAGEFCYVVEKLQKQSKVEQLNKQISNATTEIQGLKEKHETLQTEIVGLRESKETAAKLASEVESLRSRLTAATEALAVTKTEYELKIAAATDKFMQFKSKLKEHLECPICLNIQADSNLILRCGHLVCESCLRNWKKKSNLCPTCNEKMKDPPARAYIVDEFVNFIGSSGTTEGTGERSSSAALAHSKSTRENPVPAPNLRKRSRTEALPGSTKVVDLTS